MKALRIVSTVLGVAVLAGAAAFVGINVLASSGPPDGPVDVVWDRDACALCGMHVGEPAFAAQLHLRDGKVLFYDDPGCAMRHMAEGRLDVHRAWYHHVHEDRWIPGDRVAFVETKTSPMGYRLGAVDLGTPRAISYEQALRRVTEGRR